jgi:CubicO group peptidase (beta-lactamase class C family)
MRVTRFSRGSFIVLACFFTPLLPVIDGAVDVAKSQQAEFQNGLAEVAAKHGLNQVWFRAEKNGQVLANVGLGGASPNSPIHVASLSKSITAIAVALLIQDGMLTLDSKLGDLLGPMFAQRGHPLQLRFLSEYPHRGIPRPSGPALSEQTLGPRAPC